MEVGLIIVCASCLTLTRTMTVSIGVKAVIVMVSGHSQKILVLLECIVTIIEL